MILVTGATGAVGPRVVGALHDAGHRIRTLALDPPPVGIWPDGVETKIGDVTNPVDVQAAMQGVDAVVHLAALLHIFNPSSDLQQKYKEINVGGTALVTQMAVRQKVRRLLFFSTIAVYGNSGGQVLNEDAPTQPVTFYEQTKLEAEQIVLVAKDSLGKPIGTVLRLASVYGSRIKGNYRQLLEALAKGRFIPIGHGQNRRTLVYDKDVARAAILALEHPGAAGKIFNVSDGQFHTMNEIVSAMCEALGCTPPRISLPIGPVRLIAGLLEDAAKLLGLKSPMVRATIDKYIEDVAIDSQRIQAKLGFVPKFGLSAGWKDTVQEMRQMGDL